MYRFSQWLAWIAGVVLPVGETWRRWGTWWDYPPAYLDDVFIGAFLLVAAAMTKRSPQAGRPWLAGAYGFAVGIGLMNLATTLSTLEQPDPSGVSGATAATIKAVMVALAIAGLVGSLLGSGGSADKSRQTPKL